MTVIHDMTRERPGLAIQMLHHNRKNEAPDDYIDVLSGSTGITGVPDHVSVLHRTRGEADAVIKFTSRDAAEHETAFAFQDRIWTELGNAAEYQLSRERRDLYQLLNSLDTPTRLKELAEFLDKKSPTILDQLQGLEKEDLVVQDSETRMWRTT